MKKMNVLELFHFLNEDEQLYHGTTSDFKKFDTAFMGSGEGSQVFGWGVYLTSDEDLAEWYIRNTWMQGRDRNFRERFFNFLKPKNKQVAKDTRFDADAYKLYNGFLYDVQVPENTGDNYIDWDEEDKEKLWHIFKQLKENVLTEEQSKFMYAQMVDKEVAIEKGIIKWLKGKWNQKFETINSFTRFYSCLSFILGKNDKNASMALYKIGYKGITVVIARNHKGIKSHPSDIRGLNYVIFNPKDIKIVQKRKFSYSDFGLGHETFKGRKGVEKIEQQPL